MGAILLPYQQAWADDKSQFKAGMFSRQAGKTFGATYEIVDDLFEHDIKKARSEWLILSRSEDQAKEAMHMGVHLHVEAYKGAFKTLKDTTWHYYDEDNIRRTALELEWPNGNRVTALSSNPDTAPGRSRHVYFDEFALHKDSRRLWRAVFPILTRGYKCRITSTPRGKGNVFYEVMTTDKGNWSRHTVDIYEAVRQGLKVDVEQLRAMLNDDDGWAQEYELKWLDEATAWLDYELINSVENDHAGLPEHYAGGPVYLGEDISAGKGRDLWVLTVLEKVGDVLWERERLEGNRLSFATRDEMVADVYHRYNQRIVRHCIDQTGLGEPVVEARKRKFGDSRVEGVMFTSANKMTMATIAKQAFQDRKLRIRMGDRALRADLHSLKKEQGPTGTPRFVVDDDSGGDAGKSHADRAWSLFLALLAADGPAIRMEHEAIGVRESEAATADYSPELAYTDGSADFRGY